MHIQTAIVLDVKEEEKNICNITLHYVDDVYLFLQFFYVWTFYEVLFVE